MNFLDRLAEARQAIDRRKTPEYGWGGPTEDLANLLLDNAEHIENLIRAAQGVLDYVAADGPYREQPAELRALCDALRLFTEEG